MGKDNSVFDIPIKPKKISKKKEKETDIDIEKETISEDVSLPDSTSREELNKEIPAIDIQDEVPSDLPVIPEIDEEITNDSEDNMEPVIGEKDESFGVEPQQEVSEDMSIENPQADESSDTVNNDEPVSESPVIEDAISNNLELPEEQIDLPTVDQTSGDESLEITQVPGVEVEVVPEPEIEPDINVAPIEEVAANPVVSDADNISAEPVPSIPVVEEPPVDVNDGLNASEETPVVDTPPVEGDLQVVQPIINNADQNEVIEEPIVADVPVTSEDQTQIESPVVEQTPIIEEVAPVDPSVALEQEPSAPLVDEMSNTTNSITPEEAPQDLQPPVEVPVEQAAPSEPVASQEAINIDTNAAPEVDNPVVPQVSAEMQPVAENSNEGEINPFIATPNAESNAVPQVDLTATDGSNELQSFSLGSGNVTIPETLDQNYGVIGDTDQINNPAPEVSTEPNQATAPVLEKKPKKEKKPKSPKQPKQPKEPKAPKDPNKKFPWKIVVLAIVGLFIAGCVAVGLIIYKLFSVDIVNSTSNKIKEIANNINSSLNNIEVYKIIEDSNVIQFQATMATNDNYTASLDGGLSKDNNKTNLRALIKNADTEVANISYITINNSIFTRYIDDSYFYRTVNEDSIELREYISSLNPKPILDSLADIISKNINKNKFSGNIMRVTINGKTKLVNNYSYTLPKDNAVELLNRFLNSITNPTIKNYLLDIGLDHIYGDVDINIYVSLKGLEQVVISNNGHVIKLSNPKKDSYIIIYDEKVINIDKGNNSIDVKINDTKSNTNKTYNINWNSSTKENSGIIDLKISANKANEKKSLDINAEIKPVDSAVLESPINFVLQDSDIANLLYDDEYNLVKPSIDKFNILKK